MAEVTTKYRSTCGTIMNFLPGRALRVLYGEEGTTTGLSFTYDRDSLYRAKYTDGDHENLDQEEYNYTYSLYLKREGWTPMEVEDYGSDSYHSDKSDSTHAEVPEHPRYYWGSFTWKDITE